MDRLETNRRPPNVATVQLTFSTADIQRAHFVGKVGSIGATPHARSVVDRGVVSVDHGSRTIGDGEPGSAESQVIRMAYIHGELHPIVPGSPPDARPLDEAAGIFRLITR